MPAERIELHKGELQGRWDFLEFDGAGTPAQAVRLRFAEGPAYRAIVQLHCDQDLPACIQRRQALLHMPAPSPGAGSPPYPQWVETVLSEPCVEGAEHRPAPRYPPVALRTGTEGTVELHVLLNACGMVRDAVVYRSSRSRELDRSAVETMRQWRAPSLLREAGVEARGGWFRVPITFNLAPDVPLPPLP